MLVLYLCKSGLAFDLLCFRLSLGPDMSLPAFLFSLPLPLSTIFFTLDIIIRFSILIATVALSKQLLEHLEIHLDQLQCYFLIARSQHDLVICDRSIIPCVRVRFLLELLWLRLFWGGRGRSCNVVETDMGT